MSLSKSDILKIIESEPEKYIAELKVAIKRFPGTSDHLAAALADMVISCARIAVRHTKTEISKKIESAY